MGSTRRWFGRAQSEARVGRRARPVAGGLAMRGVCALVLLVGVLALVPAGASAEPLCEDTWTGASEGNWETGSNWSTGKVPTSSEVACIGSGKTVDVTGGSQNASVLEDKGTLAITSGTLELSNGLEASSAAALTIGGGELKRGRRKSM